jgi:hypothetical protein
MPPPPNRQLPRRFGHRTAFWIPLLGLIISLAVPVTGATAPVLVVASGPSPYADCATGSTAVSATNTETEPRLAIDPTSAGQRMVGVWIQDSQLGDVAASSTDGGATWHETPLPFSRCAPRGLQYDRAVDPWISIGPDGRAYATGQAISIGPAGETTAAVAASTSTDNGTTWTDPRAIRAITIGSSLQESIDKPMVLADPSTPGTAYIVWQQAPLDGSVPPASWLARTTNGGKTWSRARKIVPSVKGSGAYWNELVAAPDSRMLYNIFNLVRPQMTYHTVCKKRAGKTKRCRRIGTPVPGKFDGFIAVVKSADHGITWSKPAIVSDDLSLGIDAAPGGPITTGSGIDAAIDPRSGRVYVVWTDARFSQLRYDQVVISSSGDGGKHWTSPQPVSTVATSFNPVVAINSVGRVGVTYYDLREAEGSAATIPTDVWFTSSMDGGKTFTGDTLLGQFNMKTAPFLGGYFIGDYVGLVSAGVTFRPYFVMTTGSPDNPTDVYIGRTGT